MSKVPLLKVRSATARTVAGAQVAGRTELGVVGAQATRDDLSQAREQTQNGHPSAVLPYTGEPEGSLTKTDAAPLAVLSCPLNILFPLGG